jgi:hypothetical protein
MRMHPGVQYPLERIVPKEGAKLCGHYVPGGTIVGINATTIHRNKDVYGSDADVFRPSRWTEEAKSGDLKEMERSLLTVSKPLPSRTCSSLSDRVTSSARAQERALAKTFQ